MLTACAAAPAPVEPIAGDAPRGRPLDVLPAGADLALVREDLIATAAQRFGEGALAQARAAPTYLIAKRFAGMAPPPPPGAGADWTAPTPTALLMKGMDGWLVADGRGGWRAANAEAAAEIDQVIADRAFWSEPAASQPCPDYGASLLLLKVPGRSETVRKSMCTSVADRAVLAALRA